MSSELWVVAVVGLVAVAALLGVLWARAVQRVAVLEERLSVQASEYQRLESLLSVERAELSEQFSKNFSLLANDILEQKSVSMNRTASAQIETLLRPLGENLKDFRERIEAEGKQRFALQSEVRRLAELNVTIGQQAQSLASALRGNSKAQGDWGEMILETLLEQSGLVRDRHFLVQTNLKDESGANLRPDVVLNLPGGKQVVVDSKVSLTAYVTYTESEEPEASARALALHVASIKGHINELGAKRYDKLLGNSPDFVVLFVPTEAALLAALQAAPELWEDAYKKGVMLSSPSSLFGILRIVDDLWKRDLQSRSALEIAKAGADLYDKFVGFTETMQEVGRSIKKSGESYDKAMNQMVEGKGNLVARSEKLRTLGVKATKRLAGELVEATEGEPD